MSSRLSGLPPIGAALAGVFVDARRGAQDTPPHRGPTCPPASRADGLAPPPPASGRGDFGSAAGGALRCVSTRPSRRTSRTAFADLPLSKNDPLLGFKPYRHKAPRRNSITPERQRDFIACLAATGIVTHPVYDRLKREWQEEERARRLAESDGIARSINAKLELMRQRRLAAEARAAAEREAGRAADEGLPDAGGAAAG